MALLNADDVRRRTYYHESGHAIAALVYGGYVTFIELGMEPETTTDVKCAATAFAVWGGPWAQAYWEDDCTVDRTMDIFQTQSFHDWPCYEEARDAGRAAEMNVRSAAMAAEIADIENSPRPEIQPPVTPPHPDWDGELKKAWPEIEALAQSLLDGRSPITLSNGQELVRDGSRDDWRDPNAPTVEDDEC